MFSTSENAQAQAGTPMKSGADTSRGSIRERTVPVADIMSVNLLQCSPETSIRECARLMARERKSSVVVVENGRPVGIWTEHDAIKHDLTDTQSRNRPIRTVMSSPVATIDAGRDISEVASLFVANQLRHYVVVNRHGEAAGVVTQSDIVLNHGVEWFMRLHAVENVIAHSPIRVEWSTPLELAIARMRKAGADSLIARNPEGELGIITERDIVRHIANDDEDRKVGDIASAPVQTINASDSLFHARNLMVAHHFRHLGVVDNDGEFLGIISFRDILSTIEQSYIEELEIALSERDSALKASEERYRMLVELSPDAILVVNEHQISFLNPAAVRLLGADMEREIVDKSFWDFLTQWPNLGKQERMQRIEKAAETNDHSYLEESLDRLDGSTLEVELLATRITYNDAPALQVVMRDISERKTLERELNILARTDSLTGASNRMHFEPHLEQAVRESDRYDYRFSMIMFDIDHFKHVNDTFGHNVGDRILRELIATVRSELRESDILCRWGGEEFMILAASTGHGEVQELAQRIQQAVRRADFGIGRPVTATFATAQYQPSEGTEHFMYRLDSALYAAKSAGRDAIHYA